MSEQEFYELARERIDRKIRRRILLGVNILAFLIYFGAFAALRGAIPLGIGLLITIAWVSIIALHGVILIITRGRDEEIERETTRLRFSIYEKSKRLELTDDGELTEIPEEPSFSQQVQIRGEPYV